MENQNRFDLEQALRRWREDCANRPGISFDNARELESDLRERVADLLKEGLNENVWRERVFWMAVAALAAGLWQAVTLLYMVATLFHTGHMDMQLGDKAWFIGSYLLVELSPLLVLTLLLRHRIHVGKDVTAGRLVCSRAMFAFIPLAVCAWIALTLWTNHYWKPSGFNISWSSNMFNYLATFRWLWPVGLALLILWLAPRGETHRRETFAVCRD